MLEIGTVIDGKYKVLNIIGQGGMSVVYLAMNERANKQWAIKEVRKDGVKDFDVVKQGLIVEIEMLKKLKHPNLPSIVDVIENEDKFLIVMDYIQGNPLSKVLEEYGAQPQAYVIDWAVQLCDVLQYLHTRTPAIIYRDMKPANVMLKPDGNVTLIDFGTAREYKEKNIADTTCLGTLGYAAPEQFGGQGQTDARTDIYCLGTTMYHLLTGNNPCEPPYEILPIRQVNPGLSTGLEKIIQRCTQRNPEDRYQSCEELRYELEHYEDIDEEHIKRQKRKIKFFFTSVILTILFACIAAYGYAGAKDMKNQNYETKLTFASDVQRTKEERIQLYFDAIAISPTKTEAYLGLLDFMLSDSEVKGSFTKEEASKITQLQAGISIKNKRRFSSTIYPLKLLKEANLYGYQKVCYEIGLAFWYDYEVQSDCYQVAAEWFREANEEFPISKTFVTMGEIQQKIKKFYGQNRTEKMYDTYQSMWEQMIELEEQAVGLEDNDTKLLIWSELIDLVSSKASFFIVTTKEEDMYSFIDQLVSDATDLKNESKYEATKKMVDSMIEDCEEAKVRIQLSKKIENRS